jgi:hypothetical protein
LLATQRVTLILLASYAFIAAAAHAQEVEELLARKALKEAGAVLRVKRNPITKRDEVTELVIRNKKVTPELLDHVALLPNCKVVGISNTQLTDEAIAHLGRAEQIEELTFQAVPITDDAVKSLGNLKLKKLMLRKTKITDAGLDAVGRMKSLEKLGLGATAITDDGLNALRELSNLRFLDLSYTDISDRGLLHVAKLPKLSSLHVAKTRVTFASFETLTACDEWEHLSNRSDQIDGLEDAMFLAKLKTLHIHEFVVTDEAMKHVAKIPTLEVLIFDDANVTDAGMRQLMSLKSLRRATLPGNISGAVVREITQALPDLTLK